MASLRALEIVGVHPVIPTEEQFRGAVVILYGAGLTGPELAQAEERVREHFARLYLLEIRINPPDGAVDWSALTQPIPGQPRRNWQSPYGVSPLDERGGRWTFFFHYLDPSRPLQTPLGNRALPEVSPTPKRLRSIVYEVPG